MKKFAIVTEGGGMRCAYSAGVFNALLKEYSKFEPEILVGSSGSAGSLSYYVAKQSDNIENIWTQRVSSKNFLNVLRLNRIMSIDYLIDVIFKIQEPLHTKVIRKSKQTLFISATNYKTAKPKYFSNQDNIFEALRASKAIPIIFGKMVTINHKQYIDGSFSSPLSKNIQKAIHEGATSILIIKEEKPGTESSIINNCLRLWGFFQKNNIKKMMNRYLLESSFEKKIINQYKNTIEFHMLYPSTKLNISALDNSSKNIKEAFELGYNDCKSDLQLKEFIKN